MNGTSWSSIHQVISALTTFLMWWHANPADCCADLMDLSGDRSRLDMYFAGLQQRAAANSPLHRTLPKPPGNPKAASCSLAHSSSLLPQPTLHAQSPSAMTKAESSPAALSSEPASQQPHEPMATQHCAGKGIRKEGDEPPAASAAANSTATDCKSLLPSLKLQNGDLCMKEASPVSRPAVVPPSAEGARVHGQGLQGRDSSCFLLAPAGLTTLGLKPAVASAPAHGAPTEPACQHETPAWQAGRAPACNDGTQPGSRHPGPQTDAQQGHKKAMPVPLVKLERGPACRSPAAETGLQIASAAQQSPTAADCGHACDLGSPDLELRSTKRRCLGHANSTLNHLERAELQPRQAAPASALHLRWAKLSPTMQPGAVTCPAGSRSPTCSPIDSRPDRLSAGRSDETSPAVVSYDLARPVSHPMAHQTHQMTSPSHAYPQAGSSLTPCSSPHMASRATGREEQQQQGGCCDCDLGSHSWGKALRQRQPEVSSSSLQLSPRHSSDCIADEGQQGRPSSRGCKPRQEGISIAAAPPAVQGGWKGPPNSLPVQERCAPIPNGLVPASPEWDQKPGSTGMEYPGLVLDPASLGTIHGVGVKLDHSSRPPRARHSDAACSTPADSRPSAPCNTSSSSSSGLEAITNGGLVPESLESRAGADQTESGNFGSFVDITSIDTARQARLLAAIQRSVGSASIGGDGSKPSQSGCRQSGLLKQAKMQAFFGLR